MKVTVLMLLLHPFIIWTWVENLFFFHKLKMIKNQSNRSVVNKTV